MATVCDCSFWTIFLASIHAETSQVLELPQVVDLSPWCQKSRFHHSSRILKDRSNNQTSSQHGLQHEPICMFQSCALVTMTTETPWKPSLKSEMLLCPSDKMFSLGHPSKRSVFFFPVKKGRMSAFGEGKCRCMVRVAGLLGPCRHVYQSSEGIPFTVGLAGSEPGVSTTGTTRVHVGINSPQQSKKQLRPSPWTEGTLVASLPWFLPNHLPWIWHNFTHILLPFEMQKLVHQILSI